MPEFETYQPKDDEVEYRLVSLHSGVTEPFKRFGLEDAVYQNGASMLEIRMKSGETRIEYAFPKMQKHILAEGDRLLLPEGLPTARLWVRPKTGGMCCKIPRQLGTDEEHRQVALVPGGAKRVEVFGDIYFETAYSLY